MTAPTEVRDESTDGTSTPGLTHVYVEFAHYSSLMAGRDRDQELIRELAAALRAFVSAYLKAADPIGDSDLYDEQPRSVHVLLGDCRRAERVLREAEQS